MKKGVFIKIYRKRQLLKIVILGCIILIFISQIGYGISEYYKNRNHPIVVHVTKDYVKAMENYSYVQLRADEIHDLGLEIKKIQTVAGVKVGESITGYFVGIFIEDNLIVAALPIKEYKRIIQQEKGPYIINGCITNFADEELEFLKNKFIKNGISAEKVNSFIYPTYVDYKTPLETVSPNFILAGALIVFILKIYLHIHKSKKALESLKKYHNGDIEYACMRIDGEISRPDVYKNHIVTITQSYIIINSKQIVLALPLKELVWAYKKVTRFNLSLKKRNVLVLFFSDKGVYEINFYKKGNLIDETLQYISEHVNTCLIGYSKERKTRYKQNLDEFIYYWKTNKTV